MGAEEELELNPDRMIDADVVPIIAVVLHANLGELAGEIRQRRRDAPPHVAVGIGFQPSLTSGHVIAAQRSDPALAVTKYLVLRS